MQNSLKRTRDSEGWRRCSEGFGDLLRTEVETNKSEKTRRKSTDSVANKHKDTFTPGNIFEKLAFSSEDTSQAIAWSSSENEEDKKVIEPVKKRKKLSPRVVARKTRRSLGQHNSQVDKEVVILSSSDTEREEKAKDIKWQEQKNTGQVKEVLILSSSDTEKVEKGKSTKAQAGKRNLWDTKEVVILSSSDTEKDEKKYTQDTVPSEKSEAVSIRGYESDQEKRESSREKTPPPSQELNSQSSIIISTQSSADTQSGFGVKASDWVKSLQLKTPSKSDQASISCEVEDSAKKKKKHTRGGFAEQLNRLQNRDKSSIRVWKHQHTTLFSSQDARSVSLKVLGFEYLYSLQLIRCRVMEQPVNQDTQGDAEMGIRLVMLPVSQAEQLKLQPGAIFKIYPPWQQLELSTGQQIMLCAKYCHVLEQLSSQSDLCIEQTCVKGQDVSAVWNCPCVQGLCTSQTLCPAYQFPCVPGYVQEMDDSGDSKAQTIDNNSNTLKAAENLHFNSKTAAKSSSSLNPLNTAHVKSHLHTVGLKSKGSKSKSESSDSSGGRVWDSILESIEFVRSKGDNHCSLCFKGHVHKKAQISEGEHSISYHLFVEDVVGTVCVIKLTRKSLQSLEIEEHNIEGKTFQFSALKVHSRVTRDSDPQMLSMVDRVWSGTAVNKVTSQDSQEETGGNMKTNKPAGFCYILEELPGSSIELLPCLVDLHGEREITVQSLVNISKHCDICNRCDVIVKIVFLNFDEKKKQLLKSAFVIDHLETTPVFVKYDCTAAKSSLDLNHSGQRCKLIRDLCIDNGRFIIDDYTTIVSDTNLIQSLQTTEKNHSLIITHPTINFITNQCNIDDIVCITGVICEIDEDSAYSWEVCKNCSSDQILVDDKTGFSKCNMCKKTMDEADVRMKMEVIVNVSSSKIKVKVDLLQSTIESLLPKDEEDEDGYELSSVLNKHLGPLNCLIVQETGQNWTFFLKEIKLLS